MIDRDVRPCRHHRGEPAHNCGPCRSERIANPCAEPDRWSSPTRSGVPLHDPIPAGFRHLTVVEGERE